MACVRVDREKGKAFLTGLWQGGVMCSWLCKIFMDAHMFLFLNYETLEQVAKITIWVKMLMQQNLWRLRGGIGWEKEQRFGSMKEFGK